MSTRECNASITTPWAPAFNRSNDPDNQPLPQGLAGYSGRNAGAILEPEISSCNGHAEPCQVTCPKCTAHQRIDPGDQSCPPAAPSHESAYGSPSTPAPMMAVTMCAVASSQPPAVPGAVPQHAGTKQNRARWLLQLLCHVARHESHGAYTRQLPVPRSQQLLHTLQNCLSGGIALLDTSWAQCCQYCAHREAEYRLFMVHCKRLSCSTAASGALCCAANLDAAGTPTTAVVGAAGSARRTLGPK